jgi:ArsR family transcriptional regulator
MQKFETAKIKTLEDFGEPVYEKNAMLYRTMANPKRLHILNLLAQQEMTVEELSDRLGARMANVSQHLAVLRGSRFVRTRREGTNIFYRISDPRIVAPCRIFKNLHGL